MKITEPVTGIYRLDVPFEDITTAVFLVRERKGERYVLIDSAATAHDVDTYILPSLRELGFGERAPSALLLTHRHGDHAGGAARLCACFSEMPVYSPEPLKSLSVALLRGGEVFLDRLEVVPLPGHTAASVGYLDRETRTLLSGDCLQLWGVGRYTDNIADPDSYLHSVERLRTMELSRILASHAYVPLGDTAEGDGEIERYLDECVAAAVHMKEKEKGNGDQKSDRT